MRFKSANARTSSGEQLFAVKGGATRASPRADISSPVDQITKPRAITFN